MRDGGDTCERALLPLTSEPSWEYWAVVGELDAEELDVLMSEVDEMQQDQPLENCTVSLQWRALAAAWLTGDLPEQSHSSHEEEDMDVECVDEDEEPDPSQFSSSCGQPYFSLSDDELENWRPFQSSQDQIACDLDP